MLKQFDLSMSFHEVHSMGLVSIRSFVSFKLWKIRISLV